MTDNSTSNRLIVKTPGEFNGRQDNWEKWKNKYVNYVSTVDWRYGNVLTEIEELDRTVKIDDDWISDWDLNNPLRTTDKITKDVKQLSTELYAQLADLLQGTAGNLCRRHLKSRCGLSVWGELCLHYGIKTSLKLRRKLSRIMVYPLPETDFHNQFTAWLTLVAEYETEAGKELDDDIKTAHVTNQLTGPLASHFRLSPNITTFEEMCELIHNYHQPTTVADDKKDTTVNAMWKGAKGKGKGNWQNHWQKGQGKGYHNDGKGQKEKPTGKSPWNNWVPHWKGDRNWMKGKAKGK